jgi:hypothetical protein
MRLDVQVGCVAPVPSVHFSDAHAVLSNPCMGVGGSPQSSSAAAHVGRDVGEIDKRRCAIDRFKFVKLGCVKEAAVDEHAMDDMSRSQVQ